MKARAFVSLQLGNLQEAFPSKENQRRSKDF
jgi:hypothetical protein